MKINYFLKFLFALILILTVSQFTSGQKKILYIGADDVLGATRSCDKQIIDSLLDWGYDTLYLGHGAYDAKGEGSGIHDGIDGIMVGESCGSSSLTPYALDNFPVPAITMEAGVLQVGAEYWNLFKEETSSGAGDGGGIIVHTGEIADATDLQIKISDNSHYITEVFEKDQIITWSTAASPVLIPYVHGIKVDHDILAVPVAEYTPPATGADVGSMVMIEDNFPKVKVFWLNNTHTMLNDEQGTNEFFQIMKRASDYTYDNMPSAILDKTNEDFRLAAYPNPSDGDVTIRFHSPKQANAKVILFDVTGKQLDVLYENKASTGYNFITLHGNLYPKGLYFIELKIGEKSAYSKILLK